MIAKMDYPKRNQGLTILLYVLLGISFLSVFICFLKAKKDGLTLSLGFLGVFAMLLIAHRTLCSMEKSTIITTKTILEASNRQIKEFISFIQQIKETNVILNSVSKSLEVVSGDVLAKQEMRPNLFVAFGGGRQEIIIRAGGESEIEFDLFNGGKTNATNAEWAIFLPNEIEILDKHTFSEPVVQSSDARHPNTNMLFVRKGSVAGTEKTSHLVKIRTKKSFIRTVEIAYSCCCDNTPQNVDKLKIDFIG